MPREVVAGAVKPPTVWGVQTCQGPAATSACGVAAGTRGILDVANLRIIGGGLFLGGVCWMR